MPVNRICRFALAPLALVGIAASGARAELPEEYAFVQDLFPEVEVTDVRESPLDGFLEMEIGTDLFYVSDDGKYLIEGNLYLIESRVNLTESARAGARMAYISSFGDDESILFPADDPITTVTVFTDIDCGYCRKLHREMAEYNERGISVRYLFFPRSGPGTPSWFKAEEVWCADSRQEALTRAKNDEPVEADLENCDTSVIAEHYDAVGKLGLRGTPAIVTEDGTLVTGYRSPDELLEIVTDMPAQAATGPATQPTAVVGR